MSSESGITRLRNILKEKPFDLDKVTSLLLEPSFREEIADDKSAWSALDILCDFIESHDIQIDIINELMCFISARANPREFVLALSDRLYRVKSDGAWLSLLRPMAISVKNLIINRPADGVVEDGFHAAIVHVLFRHKRSEHSNNGKETSELCSNLICQLVDIFFAEEFLHNSLKVYTIAVSLTLAASPLSSLDCDAISWKLAIRKLGETISRYSSAYAILEDLTDPAHRYDRFLGQYFYNNVTGRWSFLKAGLACLLSQNLSDFQLPQILEPRFRFFMCSSVAAELLTEITEQPNPDMDQCANSFQSMLACNFIADIMVSVPPNSFTAECLSSIPSFTLLFRRLLLNLIGPQQSFASGDVELGGKIVKILDEFMLRLDKNGKWQLIWLWMNQVPLDSHPAGNIRALAIDKCRNLIAQSLKLNEDENLGEKCAKLLPMTLSLSIAHENVMEGQPGLIRVDAALSALSFIHLILQAPREKTVLDEQTRKTIAVWLEHELRPSVRATRNFLTATTNNTSDSAVSAMNPWVCFSSQLLLRLDLVECSLARVEQIIDQQK